MHTMNDPEIKTFLASLTDVEVFVILESARLALQDANIAEEVGMDLSVSDPDINNLQHKIQVFMEGYGENQA